MKRLFKVNYTPDGFVVSALMYMEPGEPERWWPIRNFGDRSDDALLYARYCELMTVGEIRRLALRYDPSVPVCIDYETNRAGAIRRQSKRQLAKAVRRAERQKQASKTKTNT